MTSGCRASHKIKVLDGEKKQNISKMTEKSKKAPWRNGFWLSEKAPSFVNVVDGNNLEMKPVIALDYPDIPGNPMWLGVS